ncbi:MAG: hypothetical protein JWP37_1270 [Mucilaginibacter sp.]|nr:hypothetical protein [Mucilaginibacter sp.]
MKSISFLLFFLLAAKICLSQNSKQVRVPMVKETHAVDSLIETFKLFNRNNGFKNDSCFLLIVRANNNDAILSVRFINQLENSTIDLSVKNLFELGNFRYFMFKNNFVLVIGDNDPYNWFTRCTQTKLFTINQIAPDQKYISAYIYSYKNGKFKALGDLSR